MSGIAPRGRRRFRPDRRIPYHSFALGLVCCGTPVAPQYRNAARLRVVDDLIGDEPARTGRGPARPLACEGQQPTDAAAREPRSPQPVPSPISFEVRSRAGFPLCGNDQAGFCRHCVVECGIDDHAVRLSGPRAGSLVRLGIGLRAPLDGRTCAPDRSSGSSTGTQFGIPLRTCCRGPSGSRG